MTNILKVTKPFFVMNLGDTFELSADGQYVSKYDSEYNKSDDESNVLMSKYSSEYTISKSYAEELIKQGYLAEVAKPTSKGEFINVFDEINDLLEEYTKELESIDSDSEGQPMCLKVEKQTVLNNLITVLEHLNSLRK